MARSINAQEPDQVQQRPGPASPDEAEPWNQDLPRPEVAHDEDFWITMSGPAWSCRLVIRSAIDGLEQEALEQLKDSRSRQSRASHSAG